MLASAATGTFLDNLVGTDFSVEGGYLSGNGDLPYAQFDDGTKNYAFKVSPGNGWSGKFEVNGRFESGWNISASYMHSETTKSAATPSFDGSNSAADYPVWNILGFQNNSNTPGATSYNSATVSTKVHADVIDFEAGHDVGLGFDGNLMLLGGLRIADYEQRTSMDLFCSRPREVRGPVAAPRRLSKSRRIAAPGSAVLGRNSAPNIPFRSLIGGIGFFGSGIVSALLGKQETNTTSLFGGSLHPQPFSRSSRGIYARCTGRLLLYDAKLSADPGAGLSGLMDEWRPRLTKRSECRRIQWVRQSPCDLMYHAARSCA